MGCQTGETATTIRHKIVRTGEMINRLLHSEEPVKA